METLPRAFGNWEFTSIAADGELSFGLQSEPSQQYAVWRQNLSGDRQALQEELFANVGFLRVSQVALDSAPDQVLDFVQKIQDLNTVSFDVLPEGSLSPTERDVLRWMTYLEVGPDQVSFAGADETGDEITRADRQFQEVIERMLQQISHYAWVETLLDGRYLAHSVVGWGGDLQTIWGEDLEADDYRLHQLSLHQALATRHILVRACTATTLSAAKLAVLLTNPAGAVMALPVAWKLVQQILFEIEEYRRITAE